MSLFVGVPVYIPGRLCTNPAGNYCDAALLFYQSYKIVVVIAFVCILQALVLKHSLVLATQYFFASCISNLWASSGDTSSWLKGLDQMSAQMSLFVNSIVVCPENSISAVWAAQSQEDISSFPSVFSGLQIQFMAAFSVEFIGFIFITVISDPSFPGFLLYPLDRQDFRCLASWRSD